MRFIKKFENLSFPNLTDSDKEIIINSLEETFNNHINDDSKNIDYFLQIFQVMMKFDKEKAIDMNISINSKFNK